MSGTYFLSNNQACIKWKFYKLSINQTLSNAACRDKWNCQKKTIFSIFDESFDGATRYELTMQSLGSEVRIIWKLTQPLNENESVKSEEIKSERSWSKSLFRNIVIYLSLLFPNEEKLFCEVWLKGQVETTALMLH